MVVTCPNCASWFIVCAAHMAPDEQTVQCLNCGARWEVSVDGKPVPPQPQNVSRSGSGPIVETPAGPPAEENLACEGGATGAAPTKITGMPVTTEVCEPPNLTPVEVPVHENSAAEPVIAVRARATEAEKATQLKAEAAAKTGSERPAPTGRAGASPFRLFLISLILIGVLVIMAQQKQSNDSSPTVSVPESGANTAPVDAAPARPTATVPAPASGGHIF